MSSSTDTLVSAYHLPRRFAANSKLHRYLACKCPGLISIRKKEYNLFEVLLAMKRVISSEQQYDVENPAVVICDDCLEDALDVKAMHVSEVKEFVLKQLLLIDQLSQPVDIIRPLQNGDALPTWASATANAVIAQANACSNFNVEGKYTVKPEFLKVLKSVDGVDPNQTVFHYREITHLLSQYIRANQKSFFDVRNIRICLVENDQLGTAFGVKAFARCQVVGLLRAQLTPHKETSQEMEEEEKPRQVEADVCTVPEKKEIDPRYTEEYMYRVEYDIDESTEEERDSNFDADRDVTGTDNEDAHICGKTCDSETMFNRLSNWQNYKTWVIEFGQKRKAGQDEECAATSKVAKNELKVECHGSNVCSICYIRPKDASFIHGHTSHQMCCCQCAKKIFKRTNVCPVCRRRIEKITQNFVV